jgi:GAF domain-containing protein
MLNQAKVAQKTMSNQSGRNVLLLGKPSSIFDYTIAYLRENYNYSTKIVHTLAEAVDQLSHHHTTYSVVLLDEDMDDTSSGLEALRTLKSGFPKVAIIFLTIGKTLSSQDAVRAGAYRYVTKPYDIEVLALVIQSALKEQISLQIVSRVQQLSNFINSSYDLVTILRLTCQSAVEFTGMHHSGAIRFPDQVKGLPTAEWPDRNQFGVTRISEIPVKGVAAEERLVFDKEILQYNSVKDATDLGDVQAILLGFDIQSVLIVPIIVNDVVIASFSLDSIGVEHEFSNSEIQLCTDLAVQAAIAIENLENGLLPETALDIVSYAVRELLDVNTTKEVWEQTVQSAVHLLDAKLGGIFEYYHSTGTLVLKAGYNLPAEMLDTTLKAGEGLAGRLVMSDEPYLIVQDYDHWSGRPLPDTIAHGVLGDVIAVPLIADQAVIGVLFVSDDVQLEPEWWFDEQDAWALNVFAEQAASAYVRTEYSEQVSRVIQALARFAPVGNRQETLHTIIEASRQVLRCDAITLFYYDRKLQKLNPSPEMIGVWDEAKVRRAEELEANPAVYEILERDTPYIAELLPEDPLFGTSRFAKEEQVASMLSIALRAGDQKMGVMFFNYRNPHQFTQRELDIIKLFADQAAIALQNVELFEETHQNREKLHALYDASNAIITLNNQEEILKIIGRKLVEITEATWTAVAQISPLGKIIECYLFGDNKPRQLTIRPNGNSMKVMRTGRPVIIRDVKLERDIINPIALKEDNFRAALCLPLALHSQTFGVVWIHYSEPHNFIDEEIQDLQLFVNQAVVAYDSAGFKTALIDKLRTLNDIGREISELNPQTKFELPELVYQQTSRLIDTTIFFFCKYNRGSRRELEIVLWMENGQRKREYETRSRLSGLSERVIKTTQPLLIRHYSEEKHRIGIEAVMVSDIPQESWLGVPMLTRDGVIGILVVQNAQPYKFDENTQYFLQTIANQAAIGIQNKQYADAISQQAKRIHELSDKERWSSVGQLAAAIAHRIGNSYGLLSNELKELKQAAEQGTTFPLQRIDNLAKTNEYLLKLAELLTKSSQVSDKALELTPTNLSLMINQAREVANIPTVIRVIKDYQTLPLVMANNLFVEVFVEIITNAVRAMQGQPTQELIIRGREKGDKVILDFIDTGKGINMPISENQFELPTHIRTDNETDAGFGGFGLFWVQTFLGTIGGSISVKQRSEATGTIATITIPTGGKNG